jgi:hypothetical protein
MSISYDRKLFDVVKSLSPINNSIVMVKEGDNISIKHKHPDTFIWMDLTAPSKTFNFPTDQIAFYNWDEFYQFVKLFESPEIDMGENKIIISDKSSKTEYYLKDPRACSAVVDMTKLYSNWGNSDFKFQFTQKDLESFSKASSLISSDKKRKARVYGNATVVNIDLVNVNINPKQKAYDKTYSKKFNIENLTGFSTDFSFVINADFLLNIPKRDYAFEIKTIGQIKASFVDDPISVNLFTGKIKEEGN